MPGANIDGMQGASDPVLAQVGGLTVLAAGDAEASETVVFVPGWGGTKELWWNALRLLPAGFRGVSLDLPACRDYPSMADLARWLDGWRRKAGLERMTLVGHSLGGNLCAQATLAFPESVSRLVLVDAALIVDGLPARARLAASPRYGLAALRAARLAAMPMALAGRRVPHGHAGGHWAPYARRAWLYVGGHPDTELHRQMRLLLNNPLPPERLALVGCPVLIVHGERDGVVPVEHARRLAAGLPEATLRIMPRAMHCPMDWDPPLFAQYLADFLQRNTLDSKE